MDLLLFFLLFGSWFCQLSLSSYNFQVCWTKVTICSDNAGDQSGCYVETLFNGYQQGQSNVFVPDFTSSLFSYTVSCSNCCYIYGPSSTSLSVTFKVWDDNWGFDDLLQSYTSVASVGNWYSTDNDYTVCTERIDFTIKDLGPTPWPTTPSPTRPWPTTPSPTRPWPTTHSRTPSPTPSRRPSTTPSPTPSTTPSPTYEPPADDLTLCYFILDNSDGVDRSIIGDGVCNTALFYSYTYNFYGGSTSINDATCQYDGGDCCTATNYYLDSDYYCKDPLYSTSLQPTSSYAGNSTDNTSNGSTSTIVIVVIVIVAILSFIIFLALWFKYKKQKQAVIETKYIQLNDSNDNNL